MKSLTVFTPSYNRASLLPRLYESLLVQQSNDFKWLIIDDGSSDNTREVVSRWQADGRLEIGYIYKENGGLHTGYNTAIANIDTELCVCIDSDDFMPPTAVKNILAHWENFGSDEYAGIIGQDFYMNGGSVGGPLPDVKSVHIVELNYKYHYRGDVKMVHRTELLKPHVPMPTLKGEKNFNPSYIFLKVDRNYPLLVLNENLCFVDYQPDGMSINTFNQYRNSPNSFSEMRILYMSMDAVPFSFTFRHAVHYVSSTIFSGDRSWFKRAPKKWVVVLAAPFGLLLNLYIRYKTKNR